MTFDPYAPATDPEAGFVARLREEDDRVARFLEALEGLSEQDRASHGWPAYVAMLDDLPE